MSGTYKTARGAAGLAGGMSADFDTKIAVLLRNDLAPWQELNVTAFLVSGVVGSEPGLIGEPYADADGTGYLALLRQPVVVLRGDAEMLRTGHARALSRGLVPAVYISAMFATGNDDDNRAAVRAVAGDDLDLVGLALRGPRNAVDRVFKGAALHP
jgi:hypothetical protein